ncbi:alpha/beta hydrolase [Auritidibacter ignavus]|uniref:alpha/beta hydrolase n=1 Tax=Auritidibacter ignavus TaxID=678932 RepID=UPI002467DF86|nr:alpha/beta hydrolase fold domain-containing protein [Auritidibacter ignavus]
MLAIPELRETYEKNCAAVGFDQVPVASVDEFQVNGITARYYEPRTDASAASPVALFAHGGGWVMGSLDTHDGLRRQLAVRTGYPVIAVDYRRAPEHKFPAAFNDVVTVCEWVREAGALPFDPVASSPKASPSSMTQWTSLSPTTSATPTSHLIHG